MKRVVWKFPLKLHESGIQNVAMPKGAKILSTGLQEEIVMWALCDPEEQVKEARVFFVVGTGHPFFSSKAQFIGTVVEEGVMGPFVWHVWEEVYS